MPEGGSLLSPRLATMARAIVVAALLLVSSAFGQLTAQQQADFLSIHNAARAAVCVGPVTWNANAATVAQNYANQCTWAHNAGRSTDYENIVGSYTYVGENIAAGYSDVASVMAGWDDEASSWTCSTNACSGTCGHYTQVVWANTMQVGCGYALCTTGSPFGSGSWTFWVCDYVQGGNYVGERPFPATGCGGASCGGTSGPTTAAPTTAHPTTAHPTTARPTTARPTTARPTTASPTTAHPSTAHPTTAHPTGPSNSTSAPTDAPGATPTPSADSGAIITPTPTGSAAMIRPVLALVVATFLACLFL